MQDETTVHKHKSNFFNRLKPWQRTLLAIVVALTAFFIIPPCDNRYFNSLIILDFFSSAYLLFCWIVLLTMPISSIRRNASKEDGSKPFVFATIILASLAGMVSVLLLILNKDTVLVSKNLFLLVSVSGIIFSWAIVHTVFTFHYAHLFYSGKSEGGLDFPGDEKPDYLDFAYFSFIIGCTFQVSDVEISSKKIRRVVLLHGLLAFMLNTFVVALTINIVSGLLKTA
ncbi:MAG: DUF1345 domain-containing protein [Bacteroidota bacterium]